MNRDRPLPADPAYAAEGLAQDLFFVFELRFIRNVLVIASAANSKMRARRFDAVRRSCPEPAYSPANELFSAFRDFNFDFLAGQNERDKKRVVFAVSEAFAAVHEFFNSHWHAFPWPRSYFM